MADSSIVVQKGTGKYGLFVDNCELTDSILVKLSYENLLKIKENLGKSIVLFPEVSQLIELKGEVKKLDEIKMKTMMMRKEIEKMEKQ